MSEYEKVGHPSLSGEDIEEIIAFHEAPERLMEDLMDGSSLEPEPERPSSCEKCGKDAYPDADLCDACEEQYLLDHPELTEE